MNGEELCTHILAKVLREAGAEIVIGEGDSKEMVREMMRDTAIQALNDIRSILREDVPDAERFRRIEKVIGMFDFQGRAETPGAAAGPA